ncbi:hypothetical protein [Faecalibacterium sp. I4-1-79]|uniref:hypothetical protein n=1 Tax=Faecalibacterium sp. I4-1-79 TaxID=2929494 RepID=UPI00201495CD|nr:hypothetical protein [Faecalibacterium sp. I4-1-79]UQK39679.1 hypothetical protein MTP36_12870 [Faecalibacterium sp. I4-1-79]
MSLFCSYSFIIIKSLVFFLVKRAGTVQPSLFGSKNGCVVDGRRPAKGCIKKWIHGSANKQPELSTAEEATVKTEASALPSQKDSFLSQNHFGKSGCP